MRRPALVAAAAGLAVAALAALAAPRPAAAAPYFDPFTGGMVFVGPTSAHASALYWNPAAAGLMKGLHLYVGGHVRNDLYSVERATIDTATGEPSETVQGPRRREFDPVSGTLRPSGGIFAVTWDFRQDRITAGLAVYTPYLDVQPEGHDELRYHTRGGYFQALYITPSLSYRITPRLIAGAGVSFVLARARLKFSLDEALATCAAAPCDVEDPERTSDFDLSVGGTASIAFNVGLLWRVRPTLWLAATYHSRPGIGDLPLSGEVTVTTPATGGAAVRGDATVNFRLPQMLQLAARWDLVPGRWQLIGSARWVQLSAMSTFDLRMAGPELRDAGVREWVLRYHGLADVWAGDVGVETPAGQPTRWGARLRFEVGGVPAGSVAPGQIGGPEIGVALGLEQALGGGLSLTAAAYGGLVIPSGGDSIYSPSAQTSCVAAGFDLDQCEDARRGSAINSAAGEYGRTNLGLLVGLSGDWL